MKSDVIRRNVFRAILLNNVLSRHHSLHQLKPAII